MSTRRIKQVAVLGSGVMGSRIACHLAGAGFPIILLDLLPKELPENARKDQRDRIAREALLAAIKSNPSPVLDSSVVNRIAVGNFTDDLSRICTCDWVIEVVVERLDIKQQLFTEVEKHRKPGTLISSNTSGIPIHQMAEGRSEDFRKHFCGTHFFNPPRYLRLLEIIPTPETDPAVVAFLMEFGDRFLGKTTVLCKDTPAFIANRIGVFGMMAIMHVQAKMGLTVDEIDALTGPIIGRPRSATFRTADVVGLDTLVRVAKGVADNCPSDEARDKFNIPNWLQQMVDSNWLGDKTGQGFFKKVKGPSEEKEILTLDLQTMEYKTRQKPKFASVEAAKQVDTLTDRLKMLVAAPDKAGEFYRHFHYGLFSYISQRIPEISDELYRVDDALMAGFGWEIGAFESWDTLGVARSVEAMEKNGYAVAHWVKEMIAGGIKSFYKIEGGKRFCYDPATKTHRPLPGGEAYIMPSHRSEQTIWKNNSCRLVDLGDSVLALQWNTKMGSIAGDVLTGIQTSIDLAEQSGKGLVIANEGLNFSVGANVGMIFLLAIEQEFDELDLAIRYFQNTMMRVRYSGIPVIVAPHGMTLGGACEMNLHADACCPAAETYIGLVELGVGVIPGGGGTKEFVLRASDEMHPDEPETITLKNRFLSIATAKVATSAHEGFNLGVFRKGLDQIVMNQSRRISEAKNKAIKMLEQGYVAPIPRTDVKVLGRSGLGALFAGIHGMRTAGYATEHDALIAQKLAYVMCGGDLSEPTQVSEQYLLDLEREAFLSLCGERKTLERIQSVMKGGKPVRN
ncbi:MAG: 3-hydroxyacyl-CoA dehydrogenase/enoyl-CoA hydratase family protein [Bacteroidetes bacterium]|nr:3-hydroxyacyl-CoA dehydrogenase/enoyl-CoA hydratase family protein [Bacteroidota bacterium]